MRTGVMKYVILRIDTHVLRIDLCPRKRTRIRRQKQDEDVHLFLSERPLPRGVYGRPLPRQGSWPGTRPLVRQGRGVSHTPTRRTRKGPNARTECTYRGVGAGVYGRRRIWPGTRPQYVPGQTWQASLTPPQGMNDHTRGRVFATDGGARWGVCNTPLPGYPHQQTNGAQPPTNQHQTGHRPEWMDAQGHASAPCRGVWWGVCFCAPTLPAGGPSGTRQTSPASADAPGQIRRRPQTP